MAQRRLTPILDGRVQVEPVVALHGPRSVGKSTLLATHAAAHHVPVLDLDDPETREVVLANLSLAVGQYTPLDVPGSAQRVDHSGHPGASMSTSMCRWSWMRSRRG